jgi:hypothetical protein
MARPNQTERAFLELTPTQFQALSDQKAVELLRVQSTFTTQKARHAALGITYGTISYIASLAACIYLAVHGFPKLAAMALGTPVLTVIKRMLDSRLS